MACLDSNMYNPSSSSASSSEHNKCPPLMSPRISFSYNEFAESRHLHLHQLQETSRNKSPATSDFEFSVSGNNNYSNMSLMTTADELFFKGQFLPFKPSKTITLWDEFLLGEEDDQVSLRPPKSSTRWKGLLGLKDQETCCQQA